MTVSDGPLVVFGRRSMTYDFGPGHPLTPRRFGPGIDLLRAVGASSLHAPEPAVDGQLAAVHDERYVRLVRRFSAAPFGPPEAGIGPGDVPPFAGMHAAGAMVAGGSLDAMEAILRGEVIHAFHPGGGLHHAMASRASGFCIYNDVALAVAKARTAGLRVLYLDFDVHHGDGVEAIHRLDPGVMTFSIHESGESLFPGSGWLDDDDESPAAGTVVNLPLDAGTGAGPWLAAVERLIPELAAAFGPEIVVSQHGSDAHAWDPLAHLRVTTSAMGAAARLTDAIAHRHAGGRWLATGGGGYDVYRVVPRAWALVWLAGAHRPAPDRIPVDWQARWATEAGHHHPAPLPDRFEDDPAIGRSEPWSSGADRRVEESIALVRQLRVPALIRHAVDAGWWSPFDEPAHAPAGSSATSLRTDVPPDNVVTIVPDIDAAAWTRLELAPRVAGPADPRSGHRLIFGALGSRGHGTLASAAIAGMQVVGLAVSNWDPTATVRRLIALGIAPARRGSGLGRALLHAHIGAVDVRDEPGGMEALITAAERDVIDPTPRLDRVAAARRLLEAGGFEVVRAGGPVGQADPLALLARRSRRPR